MDASLVLLITLGLLLSSTGNGQQLIYTTQQQPQRFQLIRQPVQFATFPVNQVVQQPVQFTTFPVNQVVRQPVQLNGFQTFQPNQQQNIQSGRLYYSWLDSSLGGRDFDWPQADALCRQRGQNLVSIESLEKSQRINNIVAQNNLRFIWTSGRKTQTGGFIWANGQPVQPLNWSPTGRNGVPQPDNREGNENCLGLLNNFYQDGVVWHDVACHHLKQFICE